MNYSGRAYELVRRFIGTWQEFTVSADGESLVGTLQVRWEMEDCLLRQDFRAGDGSFAFVAFGYLDPESQTWQETFVLNDGRVAHYRWREEGEVIVVGRLGGNPQDLRRLKIRNLTDVAYEATEERSGDGGQTWEIVEVTRTRRVMES
ncbi:MAG: hypothetical protein KJ069_03530 [Anaerolineae bacterium]|nr:hypothetical protein [Anaerolineae bacterium]